MHNNSVHPVTGYWYGDVPHGGSNGWRTESACPPGLSKPSHSAQARKGGVEGPPGFLSDRSRLHGQHFQSPAQVHAARDYHELQRPAEFQRSYGRSHSARRSRQQGTGYQQSPNHFANGSGHGGSFQHSRRTPTRRHMTPVQMRSPSGASHHDLSPHALQPLTPPPPAPRPAIPMLHTSTPARSTIAACPSAPFFSTPDHPCLSTTTTIAPASTAKSTEVKAISAAAASRLLDQAHKTPTQVVDSLNITEQMAAKYHILQSEDGRTILFKKTPRGRRGGVKHRRKQAAAGEGIPEESEVGSVAGSEKQNDLDLSEIHLKAASSQQQSGSDPSATVHPAASAVSIPGSEPEINTPPQPQPIPRATPTPEWSPQQHAASVGASVSVASAAAAADKASDSSRTGTESGVDDIMQELRELRAAKARAEEAQEQLTQQAQLLLQEKSQLVQQMAQKEKVIKNLEERLEFVQAECEDLRLATPNNLFASLQEELRVESDGLDSQASAELHLLQALLSGGGQGGSQGGMGMEGAAAVAAAIAQGQDGFYILDTRAAKPADSLQYFDEQQGSTLLGTRATKLTAGGNNTL